MIRNPPWFLLPQVTLHLWKALHKECRLVPTLFNLLINDMPLPAYNSVKLAFYADDHAIYFSPKLNSQLIFRIWTSWGRISNFFLQLFLWRTPTFSELTSLHILEPLCTRISTSNNPSTLTQKSQTLHQGDVPNTQFSAVQYFHQSMHLQGVVALPFQQVQNISLRIIRKQTLSVSHFPT